MTTQGAAVNFPEHPGRNINLWGLVPVKTFATAKQRLKPCLGADCAEFSRGMFMDVVGALKNSREIRNIAVVTADSRVAGIAENHGLLVIDEMQCRGHNPALELGIEAIRRRGGQRIVLLPADIPLVTGAEIDRVLQALSVELKENSGGIIGISPAKSGYGTNLLCLDTRQSMPLSFGPDSYNVHMKIATDNNLRPVTLHSATIAIDIDERRDLEEFMQYCRVNPQFQETTSWQFLQQKGYTRQTGQRRTA